MENVDQHLDDSTNEEEVTEFLDDNPLFLEEYLNNNQDVLDSFVVDNVDEVTIRRWLDKVQGPPPSEALKIRRIDYLKNENRFAHNTLAYDQKQLVVRRAATFDLDLHFKNRGFIPAKDNVVLEFSVGRKPTVMNGTKFRLRVQDVIDKTTWSCKIVKNNEKDKKLSVQVNIPSDAIIGRYKVAVELASRLSDGPSVSKAKRDDIIIIFNPFSPDDDVYMADAAKRNEYVLNDTGIIYYGQSFDIGGKPWLFGQFEKGILNIVLKLLWADPNVKKNPVKMVKKRSSPTFCSRVLSALVNSSDDKGVLLGNWSGEYEGGVKPTAWNGSVKILKQWDSSKMKAVKFGQCWVFSGVLTTVLRALGIPARSVTNFQSAHDTEYNMTIDKFVDEDGEECDPFNNEDSIWNFHVWNEGWFKRPDLPKGYDGWQALDATPQEESSGVYQCGPAPLKAIKNGEIYIGFDTNFLFAEVNADRITWRVDGDGEVIAMVGREDRHVGQNISTKAVGSNRREDVTNEYKFPEKSKEERTAFKRAYAFGKKAPYHEKFNIIENEGQIVIDIKPVGEVVNGQPLTINVQVRNTTKVTKTAVITTVVNTMLHNDERKTLLRKMKLEVPMKGGQTNGQNIKLKWEDYARHLVDHNVIRVRTAVRVKETNNLYVDFVDVQMANPEFVTILHSEDQIYHKEYNDVKFIVKNPLPVTLTGGVINLEGPGVSVGRAVKIQEPIPPNGSFTTQAMEIRPHREGVVTLIADFDCNEINNVKGRKEVKVAKRGAVA